MRLISTLLLAGAGLAAWKVSRLLNLAKRLSLGITGFSLPSITGGAMSTAVQLSATNGTSESLTLEQVDVTIFQLTTDQKAWIEFARGLTKNTQTIKANATTPLAFQISKPAAELPGLVRDVLSIFASGKTPSYKVLARIRIVGGITTEQVQYFPESAREVLP